MYKEVTNLAGVEGDTPVQGQVACRARLGNGLSICNFSVLRFFQNNSIDSLSPIPILIVNNESTVALDSSRISSHPPFLRYTHLSRHSGQLCNNG